VGTAKTRVIAHRLVAPQPAALGVPLVGQGLAVGLEPADVGHEVTVLPAFGGLGRGGQLETVLSETAKDPVRVANVRSTLAIPQKVDTVGHWGGFLWLLRNPQRRENVRLHQQVVHRNMWVSKLIGTFLIPFLL